MRFSHVFSLGSGVSLGKYLCATAVALASVLGLSGCGNPSDSSNIASGNTNCNASIPGSRLSQNWVDIEELRMENAPMIKAAAFNRSSWTPIPPSGAQGELTLLGGKTQSALIIQYKRSRDDNVAENLPKENYSLNTCTNRLTIRFPQPRNANFVYRVVFVRN